jgi:hypothetical protein
MRIARWTTMTAGLALVLSAPARAGNILLTAPMLRPGKTFNCQVANTTSKFVEVKMEVVNHDASVAFSIPASFDPGEGASVGVASGVGSDLVYCRFTVVGTSKNKVRASSRVVNALDFCEVTGPAR